MNFLWWQEATYTITFGGKSLIRWTKISKLSKVENIDSWYFHIVMNSSSIYQRKIKSREKKYIPKINSATWAWSQWFLISKVIDMLLGSENLSYLRSMAEGCLKRSGTNSNHVQTHQSFNIWRGLKTCTRPQEVCVEPWEVSKQQLI